MLLLTLAGLPAGVPHAGDPGLTIEEARTHFSIWCIMARPPGQSASWSAARSLLMPRVNPGSLPGSRYYCGESH